MGSKFLTVREVGERYRRHEVTVRIALADKSRHGVQRKAGTHWRIDEECAEAWNKGEKCPHYEAVVNLKRSA